MGDHEAAQVGLTLRQCDLCGDPLSPSEIEEMHPRCAVAYADYLERAARGDCHCCGIGDTRPGPNGGHWHAPFPEDV